MKENIISKEVFDMMKMLIDAIKTVNAVPMNVVKIHDNLIEKAEELLRKARLED